MKVLEVKDVYKSLGRREIIKGISFDVEEGEIFGFLGPNGAGKTTTIRMMVGLIGANKGTISIMGNDIAKDKEKALANVGAVVENPELYSYLSGRENLMQIARIRNIPKEEVEKVIRLVGMEQRINDKVKKYSLGMKQRLGLAAALLPNPRLLILDEPTNGLDPSGILDFRNIVKKASRERGTAVFVSSHILSEVQQVCDKVAFISGGVIQAVESIVDGVNTETDTITLITKEISKTIDIMHELELVKDVKVDNQEITALISKDSSPQLIVELVKAGIEIEEIFKKHKGVEQRYMELVEGGIR
ncbi:ABC-2 type transport system ATP-binding protein [Clostridium amylolyticum]|uniref:ABC-2 type transport system ATP-binding protein n=1 Tax=Clostridium amylolyticum TaxID=1121298 RepID=A0A1M6LF09_9CLOT|nr:ABC transporter ATP-binding protein [Clostridium amylolyticum]SHJ69811.1 ABC-2 type transport system ATP-binding protein [Clostridium amylolyticum]